MEFKDIKILKSERPIKADLDKWEGNKNIHVVFKYDNKKFNLVYEQAHYFYRGMPGTTRGQYTLSEIQKGGIIVPLNIQKDGQGEFNIPFPDDLPAGKKYVVEGYNNSYSGEVNYRGYRMLDITDEEIFDFLIKPYFELYYE